MRIGFLILVFLMANYIDIVLAARLRLPGDIVGYILSWSVPSTLRSGFVSVLVTAKYLTDHDLLWARSSN